MYIVREKLLWFVYSLEHQESSSLKCTIMRAKQIKTMQICIELFVIIFCLGFGFLFLLLFLQMVWDLTVSPTLIKVIIGFACYK